jgi:hypothetical protein
MQVLAATATAPQAIIIISSSSSSSSSSSILADGHDHPLSAHEHGIQVPPKQHFSSK